MRKVEFYRHTLGEEDIAAAEAVMRSLFLTTGEQVARFESDFSAYTGNAHTVGVTSCTAALHLSLLGLDIGPGDEVITTPMSFCATANAVLHAGATPVFVDVEEETGNIDTALIEQAITKRTKAIMPVHLYGQMCDMRRIHAIAQEHGLKVIEDAAHAVESQRDGVHVGELADTACYSFYATKNITSGEGGAVTTNNAELADRLTVLRLHGMNKSAADRYSKRFSHWDLLELGWKYNMDNIQAALLLGQLKRIDELLAQRERLWRLYEKELAGIPGLRLPAELPDIRHARHLFTVRVSPAQRDRMLSDIQDRGVGVSVHFRPIHLLTYYRKTFGYKEGAFPVAEAIGGSTLSLPLYPSLQEEELQYVAQTVRDVLPA